MQMIRGLALLVTLSIWGCGGFTLPTGPSTNVDWYQSQADTGPSSSTNCGPATVRMAAVWYTRSSAVASVEAIRASRPVENGWWYAPDVESALRYLGIPYTQRAYSPETLRAALAAGHIVILCLEMRGVSDRYYSYGGGHFVVVSGSSGAYYIVQDPYPSEEAEAGRNRLYVAREVDEAAAWWPSLIEIG